MRIAAKKLKQYPWYIRLFFSAQRKKYGSVLNSSLLWARSPRLFLGLSFLYGGLDRKSSPITPVLRSLIIVRVSQLNGCEFCVDLNSSILHQRGISSAKIESLNQWKESLLFNAQEKIILEYTEAMTLSGKSVSNNLFMALKTLLSDDEIIELTAIIAFQNMSTKFNTALNVPTQGFCKTEKS